jgi:hydrogenase maturation protein HypF
MVERAQIVVRGIVQGVGFRPYIFNLADALGLKGYVTNTSEGVFIDIEGTQVAEFVARLRKEAPPLSRITDVSVASHPLHGYSEFSIRHSLDQAEGLPFTLVSPDVSICDDCLSELLDPNDRRYLYPFVNCTNCGPRYSITRMVPYDRPNTTMATFALCPECMSEYQDPRNRRFHAQPNACPVCGPSAEFKVQGSESGVQGKEAVVRAIALLKNGGIAAIKGLGGFHIACDATNRDAVKRLRERKRKSNKPFAVMAPDLQSVGTYCLVTDDEKDLLQNNRRPIVLMRKKEISLPDDVSPNNQYIGCMLPYTPLHYLLFFSPIDGHERSEKPHFSALVMTSGNLSEEPIVRDNEEAVQKLSGIVDGYLFHNRDIFMRVDDSVLRVQGSGFKVQSMHQGNSATSELSTINSELMFIRRSRGYAPDPILLHEDGPEVLGCGADLKNTFTLTKGKFAVMSQHIGDMENYETLKFYEECLTNLKAVYRAEPVAIAHDLHPGYLSTQWAISQGARDKGQGSSNSRRSMPSNDSMGGTPDSEIKLFAIQHHYAHIGSVMAEHGLTGKVIGVAFDGTGYGTDGNLWGGEFLIADIDGFERAGQLKYLPLPGGEAAIKEPWRTAVSYLVEAEGGRVGSVLNEIGFAEKYGKGSLDKIISITGSREFSPLSSGAGRLFDAVSAILGLCDRNTFEGEAAMALESMTREDVHDQYIVEMKQEKGYTVVDYFPAIHGIIRDMGRKIPTDLIATRFHNTVAETIRSMVHRIWERTGITDVALSGGTFQNRYLLNRVSALLAQDDMNVFTNRKVPCNDACISLGQAYLVRERLKKS